MLTIYSRYVYNHCLLYLEYRDIEGNDITLILSKLILAFNYKLFCKNNNVICDKIAMIPRRIRHDNRSLHILL